MKNKTRLCDADVRLFLLRNEQKLWTRFTCEVLKFGRFDKVIQQTAILWA